MTKFLERQAAHDWLTGVIKLNSNEFNKASIRVKKVPNRITLSKSIDIVFF